MIKRSRSRTNVDAGSRDSLDTTYGCHSSSTENLASSRDTRFESTGSLYRITQFEIWFLGMVQDVNLGGIQERDPDVLLIDKVEEAQLEGKIQLLPKEEDLVTITVSKYGVKVMDSNRKDVLQRHPLHTVGQIVYYSDSFCKSNVALKIGQVGRSVYDCYVFQCYNEEQAQNICQSIKDVFDIITSHSR